MPPAAVATPNVLTSPGYLFIAPLGSALPADTVTASVFSDAWPAAWIPLGATEEGSTFSYESTVEPVTVAEFFDPIKFFTTERGGSIAFNLAHYGAANYRRALNGGVAAVAPSPATAGNELYTVEPPNPGDEVRCMVGWESLDNTVRLICRQALQGGTLENAFRKPPAIAVIPCTFNLEKPATAQPFRKSFAGTARA